MGLFGKRKEKAAEAALQPPGGGIRDLSEAPAPDVSEGLGSDLGPPAPGTAGGPPLPPMPPMPASSFSDEEPGAPGALSASPAPPPPMGGGGMAPMPQAPAPMPPASTFEPPSGSADLAMAAPAPAVQAAGGLERLDNVEQRLSDMSRRVDLLDKASDDIRNDISRIRDSIAQIEGDMRELTSLYDLISTQINPFIDTTTMEEKPAMQVEHGAIPDLDALFEPTPELAPGAKPEDLFAPTEGGAAAEGAPAQGAAGTPSLPGARYPWGSSANGRARKAARPLLPEAGSGTSLSRAPRWGPTWRRTWGPQDRTLLRRRPHRCSPRLPPP